MSSDDANEATIASNEDIQDKPETDTVAASPVPVEAPAPKPKKPAAKKATKPAAKKVSKPAAKKVSKPAAKSGAYKGISFVSHEMTSPASIDMPTDTQAVKATATKDRKGYVATGNSSALANAKTSASAPNTKPGGE